MKTEPLPTIVTSPEPPRKTSSLPAILFRVLLGLAGLAGGVWMLVRGSPERQQRLADMAKAVGVEVSVAPGATVVFEGDGYGQTLAKSVDLQVGDVIEWSFEGPMSGANVIVHESRDQWNRPLPRKAWPLPRDGGRGRIVVEDGDAGPAREIWLLVDPTGRTCRTAMRVLRPKAPTAP